MEKKFNTQPLISVIIPVYNVADYINRCVESVVDQTEKNLEIVLVDDGSTDRSPDLCDSWAEKDSRVVVIHQDNAGAAAARNRGLDTAKGQYIMFVDADDYVAPDICSMLLRGMEYGVDVDCVICGLEFVNDIGSMGKIQAVEQPVMMCGIETLRDRYIRNQNRINVIGPCGKLFRKSIWEDLRFTSGIYYEDLDIAPYVFTKCRNVTCIPDIGYYYYQRRGSASHGVGKDHKRFRDSVIIREKHIAYYEEIGQHDISVSVCKMLLDLVITSACNGWIPPEEKDYSRRIYRKYTKELLSSSEVTFKAKLRLVIFGIAGKGFYKRLVLKNGK